MKIQLKIQTTHKKINKLGNEVIEAKAVNGFKVWYDKFTTAQKATISLGIALFLSNTLSKLFNLP